MNNLNKDIMDEDKKDTWVNVEERLPEIGEMVLVYNTEHAILVGRLFTNGWTAFFMDGEHKMGILAPLYWMPLPPEPGSKPQPQRTYTEEEQLLLHEVRNLQSKLAEVNPLLIEILEAIDGADDILAHYEDFQHGEYGKKITETRYKIQATISKAQSFIDTNK